MHFDPQNSSLDKHLCFSIYVLSRAVQRMYYPNLKAWQLTYPQYLVLVVLYDEKKMTVSMLSQRLDLDSGTMTPLLKKLEKDGYVSRERSPTDERVVYVSLTDQGISKREEAFALPNMLVDRSQLTDIEWDVFNHLTHKILNNINKNQ